MKRFTEGSSKRVRVVVMHPWHSRPILGVESHKCLFYSVAMWSPHCVIDFCRFLPCYHPNSLNDQLTLLSVPAVRGCGLPWRVMVGGRAGGTTAEANPRYQGFPSEGSPVSTFSRYVMMKSCRVGAILIAGLLTLSWAHGLFWVLYRIMNYNPGAYFDGASLAIVYLKLVDYPGCAIAFLEAHAHSTSSKKRWAHVNWSMGLPE